MRHVYIVTTINFDNKGGMYSIPNLGVHTSEKKAVKHWRSVVEDREKRLKLLHVTTRTEAFYKDERYVTLREANFPEEKVRLEKWIVR